MLSRLCSLRRSQLSPSQFLSYTTRFAMSTQQNQSEKPVESAIHLKLTELLKPSALTVTNDSWQHRHHTAMREQGGTNGETHFSVQVVSEAFKGKSTMQRHRMIYSALGEEFASGLHALSLTTKTPSELPAGGSEGS